METQDNFAYLLPFIMVTFGCIFLIASRWSGASGRYWGMGYICAALGFTAPVILQGAPPEMGALIANLLFFAAFFLYGHALLMRFRRPLLVVPRLLVSFIGFAAVTYLILVEHDLRGQLIAGDTSIAVLLALAVFMVRRHVRTFADKFLVGMAGLVVIETAARTLLMMLLTSTDAYGSFDTFLASDYAFFMQVGASIVGFLLALTVLGTVMWDIVAEHRHAAERDPLTNLLNRRGFEVMLPDFQRGAVPAGSVVVGDIDHFKQVNDRFGHAAGDQVIIGFADVLRRHLPPSAIISRFGGEEFVAFLPGVTAAEAARSAETARLAFATADWGANGISSGPTASFGVSATAPGDHSAHDAIGRADASLYLAKSSGRNRVGVEKQLAPAAPSLRIVL